MGRYFIRGSLFHAINFPNPWLGLFYNRKGMACSVLRLINQFLGCRVRIKWESFLKQPVHSTDLTLALGSRRPKRSAIAFHCSRVQHAVAPEDQLRGTSKLPNRSLVVSRVMISIGLHDVCMIYKMFHHMWPALL